MGFLSHASRRIWLCVVRGVRSWLAFHPSLSLCSSFLTHTHPSTLLHLFTHLSFYINHVVHGHRQAPRRGWFTASLASTSHTDASPLFVTESLQLQSTRRHPPTIPQLARRSLHLILHPHPQLISSKPRRGRGRSGRGGRSSTRGSASDAAPAAGGARARYAGSTPRSAGARAPAPAAAKPLTAEASKIIISNLPVDVTEAAVRDLMQSTVGPVRTVQMSYTAAGKSTGTATVLFKNKGDANKAHATCMSTCLPLC